MVVLIDAKYYGAILHRSRQAQNIKACDAAKMFRISLRELRRYEHGKDPIPENILMALCTRGFCMLRCKMN